MRWRSRIRRARRSRRTTRTTSGSPMQPLIQASGITKTYDADQSVVHALRGVDLLVQRGEFVALIGPSGSGKSTLMAILGCLDSPTSGQYTLDGQSVEALPRPALARVRNEKI